MKSLALAIPLIVAFNSTGYAETCQETFVRLLVDGNGDTPVKTHVTQEIKGGMKSKNIFYMAKTGHWMTEMVEPENMAWTLTHDNVMYTSSDKGKSWKKVRTLDSQANDDKARNDLRDNAGTTSNAVCGEEAIDGVIHDTVEADYETLQNFKTRNHNKYWVNRETGWIVKTTYLMKGKGFESFTTQVLEKAPGLSLPTP